MNKGELFGLEFKELDSIFKGRSIAGAEIIFYTQSAYGVVFMAQDSISLGVL